MAKECFSRWDPLKAAGQSTPVGAGMREYGSMRTSLFGNASGTSAHLVVHRTNEFGTSCHLPL
jgi:hypothetical protein